MTVADAAYARNVMACIAAAARWRAEHPDARLKFNPITITVPRNAPVGRRPGLIAGLDRALEHGVAGNSVTRQLLTAIDRGCPNGGASVMMAEFAILQVYGIESALTRWEEAHDKARMD